jgi:cytochrome c556
VKTRFIVTAALAVLLSGGLTLQVVAQDAATTLKNRQEAMKGFGGNMKAINEFVEKGAGTPADVEAKAGAIEEGSKQIVALFPAGTGMDDGVGKTGAKKEIWDKPDEFKAAADNMGMLAGKLKEAAATGDKQQIADAFGALGKNGCGGCHQTFRAKLD